MTLEQARVKNISDNIMDYIATVYSNHNLSLKEAIDINIMVAKSLNQKSKMMLMFGEQISKQA